MFEFVKPMSEVGTPIVLSALVVWFFYKLSTYFFVYLDGKLKTSEELGKPIKRHDLEDRVHRDMENREKLIRLQYELDADRVLLFAYHNGTYDLNGVGFLRISCVDEITSYGTKPMSQFYKNIPIAFVTLWNRAVVKKESFEILDIEELGKQDVVTYEQAKVSGMQSFFALGWYDENGLAKGYIQLTYCKKKHEKYTQQQMDLVEQTLLMLK